jgi:Protein of unknown function (DUF2796)
MRDSLMFGAALAAAALVQAQADERRELGAHLHGHSTLQIVIEGGRVAMELEAPGMDIVGFEHAAATDAQKAALAEACSVLARPLELFAPPPEAGCEVIEAAVELATEAAERTEDQEQAEDAPHAEAAEHHGEEAHAEGEAAACRVPGKVRARMRGSGRAGCHYLRFLRSVS